MKQWKKHSYSQVISKPHSAQHEFHRVVEASPSSVIAEEDRPHPPTSGGDFFYKSVRRDIRGVLQVNFKLRYSSQISMSFFFVPGSCTPQVSSAFISPAAGSTDRSTMPSIRDDIQL